MSLRIRFRFDGKCSLHPRYNPARDGRPQHSNCEGCESLYVIHLYTKIAKRRAENENGILVRTSSGREEPAMDELEQANRSPLEFLSRHVRGDWGDLCPEDKTENELSLKHGFRLLSSYPVSETEKLWIITEADRSVTTLLLPAEY
jgi:hypothetical protein